jgi:hypothetical protein
MGRALLPRPPGIHERAKIMPHVATSPRHHIAIWTSLLAFAAPNTALRAQDAPIPRPAPQAGEITPSTELAIQRGLKWLVEHQAEDGGFGSLSLRSPRRIAGLSGLAFMSKAPRPRTLWHRSIALAFIQPIPPAACGCEAPRPHVRPRLRHPLPRRGLQDEPPRGPRSPPPSHRSSSPRRTRRAGGAINPSAPMPIFR